MLILEGVREHDVLWGMVSDGRGVLVGNVELEISLTVTDRLVVGVVNMSSLGRHFSWL